MSRQTIPGTGRLYKGCACLRHWCFTEHADLPLRPTLGMHELPVPIVKGVILKASQIPGTATASMPSQEEITAVKNI